MARSPSCSSCRACSMRQCEMVFAYFGLICSHPWGEAWKPQLAFFVPHFHQFQPSCALRSTRQCSSSDTKGRLSLSVASGVSISNLFTRQCARTTEQDSTTEYLETTYLHALGTLSTWPRDLTCAKLVLSVCGRRDRSWNIQLEKKEDSMPFVIESGRIGYANRHSLLFGASSAEIVPKIERNSFGGVDIERTRLQLHSTTYPLSLCPPLG